MAVRRKVEAARKRAPNHKREIVLITHCFGTLVRLVRHLIISNSGPPLTHPARQIGPQWIGCSIVSKKLIAKIGLFTLYQKTLSNGRVAEIAFDSLQKYHSYAGVE